MLQPTKATIYNVLCSSADTEYSQELPRNAKKIKVFAMDSNKQYAHTNVVHLAFEANADDVIPIQVSSSYELAGVNLEGKTLYFESPTANYYVIIEVWQ